LGDPDVIVVRGEELTSDARRGVFELFRASYRDANDAYLARSLTVLGNIAVARDHDGRVVGFALGETRMLDVPRVGVRPVGLAGVACVEPQRRRQGLFRAVATAAMQGDTTIEEPRPRLVAGRVAHPASYRSFALPTAVPRPRLALSLWHKEVGAAVAAAYGAANFDAEHFVCIGSGSGPGEPALDVERVTDDELELFSHVDRARGDSLLVIGWFPEAPPGWL
jgi:GNAT superfamily N-acetyltransferase